MDRGDSTVGHGTTDPGPFIGVLRGAGVAEIVDVRRFPGSRRHPHFGGEGDGTLAGGSQDRFYRWLPSLGGRRRVRADSRCRAAKPQFRAYADHMATSEFAAGVAELVHQASEESSAVMCAESLWWRCHRRLLADHLVLIEEVNVVHLFPNGRRVEHLVTPGAAARRRSCPLRRRWCLTSSACDERTRTTPGHVRLCQSRVHGSGAHDRDVHQRFERVQESFSLADSREAVSRWVHDRAGHQDRPPTANEAAVQAPTAPPQPAGRVVGRPLTSAQLDVLHSLLDSRTRNLAARLARSGPPLSPVRGDAALDRAMAALAQVPRTRDDRGGRGHA